MIKWHLLFLLLLYCQPTSLLAQEKPNILFLLVDDLGYHDLSCHGSPIYQTPHIDSLAAKSVSFTNAYSNYPRCVPSRYALMTGKYPVVDKAIPDDGFPLETIPQKRNFIHQFNQAGYRTAYLGKWHLGDGSSSPKALGYDVTIAAGKAGSPMSYFHPFNQPKGVNRKVRKAPIDGLDEKYKEGDYLTDVLTEEAIEFVENNPKNDPFLLVLSYYAVHQPLEAKPKDISANQKEINNFDFGESPAYKPEGTGRTKMRQDNPAYAGMVENLDKNVGRILKALEKSGQLENTIIVFSSDHGGLSNDGYNKRKLATSNYPLRAGKGWMYEGGIRIPLFFHYGKKWKARQDTQSVVMLMDIFPTLLDLTSQKKVKKVDGKSILPVLKKEISYQNRTVYWHASNARPRNTGESKSSAIRSGEWKLIHFYEENIFELYHLPTDISEQNNLVQQYPEKAKTLQLKWNQWKASW